MMTRWLLLWLMVASLGAAAGPTAVDPTTGAEVEVIAVGADAATLGSGTAADGHVLTADGAGGTAFEAPAGGGGSVVWGDIGGDIADQTDLTPAAIGAAPMVSCYIDRAALVRTSNTQITVGPGVWALESGGYVASATAITASVPSIAANTWYHVYGYADAGTPAIEISTTGPAAAYACTAKSKTGDTSRRYLGSVRTRTTAAELVTWTFADGEITWVEGSSDTTFRRVVAGGSASQTAAALPGTTVSLVSAIPAGTGVQRVTLWLTGGALTGNYYNITPKGGAQTDQALRCSAGTNVFGMAPVIDDGVDYAWNATGQSAFIQVMGYLISR